MIEELQNVWLRETSPGVVRMDHDSDQHDDRAIALVLAASKLIERPIGKGSAACDGEPILGPGEAPLDDQRGLPALTAGF